MTVMFHPDISLARAQGRIALERTELDRIRENYARRLQSIPGQCDCRTDPGRLHGRARTAGPRLTAVQYLRMY